MDDAKEPDPHDVDRLRELLVETPNAMSIALSTSQGIRHQLIEKISHGVSRAFMLAEVDKLTTKKGSVFVFVHFIIAVVRRDGSLEHAAESTDRI